jgi:FkbM family methyltransferase
MILKRTVFARIPVTLEVPEQMTGTTRAVMEGEYESGYCGEGLTILDIGANIGSFATWANLRWPLSIVHAYEPHPETFQALAHNVANLRNVHCHDQAVCPSDKVREPFYSRYAGDGESALVDCAAKTFQNIAPERTLLVPVIHPRNLPRCDVVKIDVEGAEASILEHMDLVDVSLILLEYQNVENRDRIQERLKLDFVLAFEDGFSWDRILPASDYRKELAGDRTGHMFFVNKRANKLRKDPSDEWMSGLPGPRAASSPDLPLKGLLAALPGAAKRALERRLRRLRAATVDKKWI